MADFKQVGDDTGAGNGMTMGNYDQALCKKFELVQHIEDVDEKVDMMCEEMEALQKGMAALSEQSNAKYLYNDLLAESLIKKDKDINTLHNRVLDL